MLTNLQDMKKEYINPTIEIEDLKSEEILLSTSDTPAESGVMNSKERETVDFSKDMDF